MAKNKTGHWNIFRDVDDFLKLIGPFGSEREADAFVQGVIWACGGCDGPEFIGIEFGTEQHARDNTLRGRTQTDREMFLVINLEDRDGLRVTRDPRE